MSISASNFNGVLWGLGNPGSKYAGTRHNLGAMAVEALAKGSGEMLGDVIAPARAWSFREGENSFLLLSNTVFINESGAVARALTEAGFEAAKVLVLVDDLSLPFGSIRLRESGSAGSHNGLKGIETVWAKDYPRLRLGIGPVFPPPLPTLPPEGGGLLAVEGLSGEEWRDYVLSRFSNDEEELLPAFLKDGGEAALDYFKLGLSKARDQWNRKGLPKTSA